MPIRIISLVILFNIINSEPIYSNDNNNFIYPKNKPSIFKKKLQNKDLIKSSIYPVKKPEINIQNAKKKIPKQEIKKEQITVIKSRDLFVYPKKKPISYKTKINTIEKSEVLNKKDFEYAKKVFVLIKARKWNSAIKLSQNVKDKEFRNLVNWMYLKTSGNRASFNDYQKFIERNSDYPRINRLIYLAEHKIFLRNNSPTAIISWFKKYPPVSGMGKIKLAEAFLEQGKTSEVSNLIKDGWSNANISKNELGYYRAKFKKFLTSDDHIKRADYLAWNSKYWDLRRMLKYLPKDEKALYNARQILISSSYGVDKAISSVPEHLKKDTGLEYDRLKWRNRRGRLEQSLEILYENGNKSEEDLVYGDLWWKQRESVVRTLIYKKRYKTAYKVASEHSLTSGPDFAQAEWLSGWIALSFLKSGEYAINHFENFYNNVGYPISLARGAYWLGQSYKDLGNKKMADEYFKEGSKFLTTYYGQLSFNEINYGGKFELTNENTYTKEYEKEFKKNRLIKHITILNELDQTQYGKDIFKHLSQLNIEAGSEALAAKLATSVERYDFAIQISKQASYKHRFYNQFNYPIISTPREINKKIMPKPELILAIIRQESEFDRRANSYVGARGMMQLMKYTAKVVAKKAGLPYSISRLTKDPEYNIKLGSYYFNSLLKDYGGVYPFAIAAYNAGPNRVKTWRKINGDPTKGQISFVNWVELIRFKETRNYVQRVLENVNVYKYMLNSNPVGIENFFKQ